MNRTVEKLLELREMTKHFGGLAAVQDIDLHVERGEILGLIGPNGAGKTTVFNLVSGALKPTRGQVFFEGREITGQSPNRIATRGLVRTFQANTLFPESTVTENVVLGSHLHTGIGILKDLLNPPSTRRVRGEVLDRARQLMDFVGLDALRSELAKNLPHGHQRALGVCIALAAQPKLLMLDEPVTGMNVAEKQNMMGLINRIRERGVTVLVVEHDMRVVMGLCDRIAVINFGVKIAEGVPDEIRANPAVIEAYLGAEET